MRKSTLRPIAASLLCTVLFVPAAVPAAGAQARAKAWSLAVSGSLTGFRGAASGSSNSGSLAVRPSQGIALGLAATRRLGLWGVSLGLSYLPTHVEAVSAAVAVQDRTEDLERVRLAITAARQLLRIGAGRLELRAGPALDSWSAGGKDRRTIGSGEAAFALLLPAGPIILENVLGVSWSPGPFRTNELPADYERKGLRAVSAGIGIRLGL